MWYLALILITSGLLNLPVQCLRDEDQDFLHPAQLARDFQTMRDVETTVLHVRGDGKQTIMQPADGNAGDGNADDNKTEPTAPNEDGEPREWGCKEGDPNCSKWQRFLNHFDARKHKAPISTIVVYIAVVSCVLASLMRCIRRSSQGAHNFAKAKKKGKGVHVGTILVCINDDPDSPTHIYKDMKSEETIGAVEFDSEVIVADAPKKHVRGTSSRVMVPIQPKGAVELHQFQEKRAQAIKAGTILVCTAPAGEADVALMESDVHLGKVNKNEKVVARDRVFFEVGSSHSVVPIRPRGVVELEFFTVSDERKELKEDDEELAQWSREQMEGLSEIQDQLKELRLKKNKILMGEAVRMEKLREVLEELNATETELSGVEKPFSDEQQEEIRTKSEAEAEAALAGAELAAHKTALITAAYVAPVVTRSDKLFKTVEHSVETTRQKGKSFALEEGKECMQDVQKTMGYRDDQGVEGQFLQELNIPSLATMLASVMAPMQLSSVYTSQVFFATMSALYVISDVVALITDFRKPCLSKPKPMPPPGSGIDVWVDAFTEDVANKRVYFWFAIDFFVHLAVVMIRVPNIRRIGARMAHYSKPPKILEEHNSFETAQILYEYYTTSGIIALLELDATLASTLNYMASWSVIYDAAWLFYAVDLVFHTPYSSTGAGGKVADPTTYCQTWGIQIMRVRAGLFQLMLLLYLSQVVMFAVSGLAQNPAVANKLSAIGQKIDKNLLGGFPVAKVLVTACLGRHGSDMILIELQMHKMDRDRARRDEVRAEQRLKYVMEKYRKIEDHISRLEAEHEEEAERPQDAAALAEFQNKKHQLMVDNSKEFGNDLAMRSAEATRNAMELVAKWERGEGEGVEYIQAFAKGEGFEKMGELLQDVDATQLRAQLQRQASDAAFAATASMPSSSPTGFAPMSSLASLAGRGNAASSSTEPSLGAASSTASPAAAAASLAAGTAPTTVSASSGTPAEGTAATTGGWFARPAWMGGTTQPAAKAAPSQPAAEPGALAAAAAKAPPAEPGASAAAAAKAPPAVPDDSF